MNDNEDQTVDHFVVIRVRTDNVRDIGTLRRAIIDFTTLADLNDKVAHGVVRGDFRGKSEDYERLWQTAQQSFLGTMPPEYRERNKRP